jgi:hypothetical protein
MLSDAEQRRLFEIETSLRSDDPAFARRFDTGWTTRRPRTTVLLLVLLVAAMVTVAGLVTSAVVVAVIGLLGIGTAACVWASHRLH